MERGIDTLSDAQTEKPVWMSEEDWKDVLPLPVSTRQTAITLRQLMLSRAALGNEASEQAAAIRVATATGPTQTTLAAWCGYPTDLTRCSPFFPMNAKNLGHRDFLRGYLITSAGWGAIKYTGPKLSTHEEDALMALLAILDNVSQRRTETETDGRKTYTYRGPAWPLLRLLGYAKPGKDAYKRLIDALKLLTVAGVELSIAAGNTKGGKRKPPRISSMSAMLANVHWDEEKKELTATVNPFFYETYYAGTITLVDVSKRVAMKGVIAKALYRFTQSHRQSKVFEGHYLTLADALNMDREQPAIEIRRRLKTAIAELIRHGILTKKSRFVAQDIVRLEREKNALPSLKKGAEKTK
ncbi:MAG: hypothetical protein PHI97_19535 [Desulfobulbus sp.]|nr:hypothetical protein [Desulfobulbus sp.]